MIVFGSHIMREMGFSQDRAAYIDELPRISRDVKSRGSGTILYDAIHRAMALLSPAGFGDVIYVISDGQDTRSKINPEKLENLILTQQLRLFLFRLDPSARPADVSIPLSLPAAGRIEFGYYYSKGIHFMENLCVTSGGMRLLCNAFLKLGQGSKPYKFTDAEMLDLSTQLKKFNAPIFTFYRLDIELPSNVKRNAKLSLTLTGKQFSPNDNLLILYSRKIPVP